MESGVLGTPKSLERKGGYFMVKGDFDKLLVLLECFAHYRPSIDQIRLFYRLKSEKTIQVCFGFWKEYVEKMRRCNVAHDIKLKSRVLSGLSLKVTRMQGFRRNSNIVREMVVRSLWKNGFVRFLENAGSKKASVGRSLLIFQSRI